MMTGNCYTDLERVDKSNYKYYDIDEACGLEEFLDAESIEFSRGCTFYEFKRKTEYVHQNSMIILYKV
jgi:hypothetical protein